MHVFPEAKRWDYYKPLRPFQKGAFTMAYKYNMPLLPCVITYRERTGIFRLFGPKNMPLLQVEIGEPILPDKSQPRAQEVNRLLELSHKRMEQMAGITHNPWPDTL
jgi:1-acyl-sn-glycerol-3-phosphate acyltransferase